MSNQIISLDDSNDVVLIESVTQGAPGIAGINAPGSVMQTLLYGESLLTQEPSGTDVLLQLEYGAAQKTGSDPVMLSAAGVITFNVAGTYFIDVYASFGRANTNGEVHLFGGQFINGVQQGGSASAIIDSQKQSIPFNFSSRGYFPAGTVLTGQLMRGSTGVNDGGIYSHPSPSVLMNDGPSASIRISRFV